MSHIRGFIEMGVKHGFLSALSRASRCVAYFFGLAFAFLAIPAHAQFAPSFNYNFAMGSAAIYLSGFNSAQGACEAGLAAYMAKSGNSYQSVSAQDPNTGSGNCIAISPAGHPVSMGGWTRSGSGCPSNSTMSGGSCTCNAGFEYTPTESQKCTPVDEAYCKSALKWGSAMGGSGVLGAPAWYEGQRSSGVYCDDQNFDPPGGAPGCIVEFEMSWSTQVNGEWRTSGIARMMDHGPYACSPSDPNIEPPKIPEKPDRPDTCKPPLVAGYVNGQVHCYKPSDKNPMEQKPTTRTEREVKDNGDGTRTETTRSITTTTTCTGGSCNTTTVTNTNTQIINNSDNSVISNTSVAGETESSNPFDGFCKANPGSPLCGDGDGDKSSWGGSCTSGFRCDGDAIQCAMAQDQHKRNCQLFEPQGTEEENLFNAAKGKHGTNQTGDNPNNETIDLGFVIDQSDAIGGGTSGVSDLTVTIWDNSVTLPFSQVNQYLAWLGNLLVAVSMVLAVRIVTRG